jgi:nitric oxide reductase NorD protein
MNAPVEFELREPARAARSFVRALWGLDVSVSPLPALTELVARRPRFIGPRLWLPSSALLGVPGSFSNYLLAAAAHIAAHLRFGSARFQLGSLKPAQVAIISLLEDARVERLAVERYPGLARLWAPFFQARAGGAKTSGSLLARLARALHDDSYVDDDGWVSKARAAFFADRAAWFESRFVRDLGGRLGNDLGQMRVQFNAKDYVVEAAYRDDNVGLWQFEQESDPHGTELELELEGARRTQGDQPPREQSPAEPASAERTSSEQRPLELRVQPVPAAPTVQRYPEWDYVISRERPEFCAVLEKPASLGDVARLDAALARYAPARRQLQRSALRLVDQQPIQLRRLASGDRLDLPAAIAAVVARVSGARPDPRVYRRLRFQIESPALLVLLDCSESLNEVPPGASSSVLEHARWASALLAATLSCATRDWAIHGFSSNGRHEVGYTRLKDFDEPYDQHAQERIAGMRASLSTRLGTALRHAGRALSARKARRKLLLVVTDGEPSDVDVHDAQYLQFDAQRATRENHALGVTSFCFGLNSALESGVRGIFGSRNYVLLDHAQQLPKALGQLYLRLAR